MPHNQHGIPDDDLDIEFYAATTWDRLLPTKWSDICKIKPDVAAMHRKHVKAMVVVNCIPQHAIRVVSEGRLGWNALDDKDKEFQVNLAGKMRELIRDRMKK